MTTIKTPDTQWQALSILPEHKIVKFKQRPCIIWFTGLSGAGKTVVANALEEFLFAHSIRTSLLDGDNIRHGLCSDLGFSEADRIENIRRVAEVAKLMADAGLIVLASFISPMLTQREFARKIAGSVRFIEVYMSTPLNVCEARDVKGLYKKAREKQIANFTGIDSPYEPPENPEITIDSSITSVESSVERVVQCLNEKGILA